MIVAGRAAALFAGLPHRVLQAIPPWERRTSFFLTWVWRRWLRRRWFVDTRILCTLSGVCLFVCLYLFSESVACPDLIHRECKIESYTSCAQGAGNEPMCLLCWY